MRFRWGKVVIAGVVAEIVAIATLVGVVAFFGPADATAARDYAERLGQWIGPIGGAAYCFIGGYWAARSAGASRILYGVLVGVVAALIDVALLVGSGADFQILFVASNLGRMMAGALGGWASNGRAS
jgi:hypothetical protein